MSGELTFLTSLLSCGGPVPHELVYEFLGPLTVLDGRVGKAQALELAKLLPGMKHKYCSKAARKRKRGEDRQVVHKQLFETVRDDPALTLVSLYSANIRACGCRQLIEAFKVHFSITVLNLPSNQLGNEGARFISEALRTNRGIIELNLSLNQITLEGMLAIAQGLQTNSTLEYLYLNNNKCYDKGACALAKVLETNTALKGLEMRFNGIGDLGGVALLRALETNCSLSRLDLSCNGNMKNPEQVQFLSVNSTLQELELDDIALDAGYVHGVTERLKTNASLRSLRLECSNLLNLQRIADVFRYNVGLQQGSFVDVDAKSLKIFGESLASNKTLKLLELRNCEYGGIPELLKGLSNNRGLKFLYLSFADSPSLRDVEVSTLALAQALKTNTTLQYLFLDIYEFFGDADGWQRVHHEIGQELGQALRVNRVLEELHLMCARVTTDFVRAFVPCLRENRSLKTLALGSSVFSWAAVDMIIDAAKSLSYPMLFGAGVQLDKGQGLPSFENYRHIFFPVEPYTLLDRTGRRYFLGFMTIDSPDRVHPYYDDCFDGQMDEFIVQVPKFIHYPKEENTTQMQVEGWQEG